ncbi:mediator of RNA polymerase II transcription subunit 9 [Chironomus tepperi]|uniref:mediator of RNA polymerase II transcription subunit 9 n=1 Tax=Chironomus tepperi TaxID=113505 RepID=UPI00391F3D01
MSNTEESIPQIDVISVLSEIIRKFERYNSSIVETKSIESQEVSQKIIEFQKRLDEARTLVKSIPGIDQSKSQQLEHLESLKKQLVSKQELINKYKQYNF